MLKNIKVNLFGKEIEIDLKQVNIFSGYNGSGKTTILKEIHWTVTRVSRHPVLINHTTDYLNMRPSLIKIYYEKWKRGLLNTNSYINFINLIKKYLGDKVDLFIDNENTFKTLNSYKRLSKGEERLLVILVSTLNISTYEKDKRIIIIDDIESNLHFDIQKNLIADMISICPDIQIICSTHSPAVIMNGWRDCVREMSDVLK